MFTAVAASAGEPSFERLLEESLPGMSAQGTADRQQPQQRFQDACFALGSPGRETQREAACKLIAMKLGPEVALPARIWLLKQLEFIGRGECVDAVAAVMGGNDGELRDSARRALTNVPAPQANEKLLEALGQAKDETWKIAILNSLGYRGESASVGPLAVCLGDSRESVAVAAAIALGKIGAPEAIEALDAARAKAAGTLRTRIDDAYLQCADRLLARAKSSEAASAYAKLCSAEQPRPIRLAAMEGRLRTAGDALPRLILDMLAAPEPDIRAIAAGHVAEVSGQTAMKTFADGFANLPNTGKALLLAGLASRGDKAAGLVALDAAKSNAPEVQLAGIRALAKLGDAGAVPLLIAAMATGGDAAAPARDSLEVIYGTGVDEAIVAALKDAGVGLRASLIEVIESRRATVAVPVLLELAAYTDGTGAIRTLGKIAQPESLPALIDLLLKTGKGRERDDVEKAIMLVAGRVGDPGRRATAVLTRLRGADNAQRSILLPVLGRIGGQDALAAVQEFLNNDNAEVRDAALRALSNWPDASVAPQLLDIVNRSDSQDARTALRAYIRVISLPSDRPAAETLAMLKLAMEKASLADEKKLILSRASSARCMETLRWVLPYVDDPQLARDASLAVVELAHHRELMGPNHQEFMEALKKVTDTCKDPGIVDRAKRYMQGL